MPRQTAALPVQQWIRRHPVEIALFVLGCLFRMTWMRALSLWSDEALTFIIARANLGQILPLVRQLDTSPPLHHFLAHFWLILFSDPLFALRSFSVVCGIMALGVFYFMCREIVPENTLIAFFMGCFSSYWIHMAQDGRFYSLYLLIALLEIWIVFRLKDRWTKRLWFAYAFFGCLGIYTHYYFLILIFTHFLYLSLEAVVRKKSWMPLLLTHAALLLLYLPWMPYFFGQMNLRSSNSVLKQLFDLWRLGEIFGSMTFDASQFTLLIPAWIQAFGFLNILMLFGSFILLFRGIKFSVRMLYQTSPSNTAFFFLFHLLIPLCCVKAAECVTGIALVQSRYFAFLSPFVYWTFATALKRLPRFWAGAVRVWLEILMTAGICAYFGSNLNSLNLSKVSSIIRSNPDHNIPIIYLESFYYLPMRYYYMPERKHLLVPSIQKDVIDLEFYPGYSGLIFKKDLSRINGCIVFDPSQQFIDRSLWLSTGRQLSTLLEKRLEWK